MARHGGADGGALADLARAGVRLTRHGTAEVAFEIHHLADRPGYLMRLHGAGVAPVPEREATAQPVPDGGPGPAAVPGAASGPHAEPDGAQCRQEGPEGGPEVLSPGPGRPLPVEVAPDEPPYSETLSSAAYGSGLVIRTAVRPARGPGVRPRPTADTADPNTWVFSGRAQPNPSFLYESTTTLEGLVAIEVDARRLLTTHGEGVRQVATTIADTAVAAGCPILYLQAPAQLPQSSYREDDPERSKATWARSSGIAVRFALAIGRATSTRRSEVAASLAEFCAENGLGLWLRDSRPAHRSGNWFSVVRHDQQRAKEYLNTFAVARQDQRTLQRTCPVTFVGPARVGSTRGVLRLLGLFQPAPVAAMSIASLDDLAFIHLQLAVPRLPGEGPNQPRARLADWSERQQGGAIAVGLPSLLHALGLQQTADDLDVTSNLAARAGDYQMFAGPVVTVQDEPTFPGRPLWLSWDVEKSRAGLGTPLSALADALAELGLLPAPGGPPGPPEHATANVEYLLCRDTGDDTLRAKGKLRVPDTLLGDRGTATPATAAALARDLEESWQARFAGRSQAVGELTVAWREPWLGHWSPTG